MIGRLTGRVLECLPDRLLLDVAGVGYALRIPLSTYYTVNGDSRAPVSLHVHTHVREDALDLYGFASRDERATFEQLIAISGVGPRMALAVLSGIGVDDLRRAVVTQDRARLEKIPGVGKKTAQRMLLELRDKMDLDEPQTAAAADGEAPARSGGGNREDAVSALANLGYSVDRADRAVGAAIAELGNESALEAVLKTALKRLVR
jgi:Holliday junction DNA helicase RuvA